MYFPIQPDLQAAIKQLDNIPSELKALKQWVVWRYTDIGTAKPTKVPFNPITGKEASVTDVSTWVSFNDAVTGYASGNYSGIGFVFSINDPYCFLDMDQTSDAQAIERQRTIFKEFDSYSEVSPSGQGLHIIIKGFVPVGRRRNFIEIYSSVRYATFTGNVYHNVPIQSRQAKLQSLWEQLGGTPSQILKFEGDPTEKCSDAEIIEQASNAVNGDKFISLFKGEWSSFYQSQSEADFAIIDIIAFYTKNKTQIIRIFKLSALGKRDKANRTDYLNWMVNKSFDKELPNIDMDGFKNDIQTAIHNIKEEVVMAPIPSSITPLKVALGLPPGLLGEIAQFIYSAAPRPVPEIAIAAAIGLMAGICGRAYNVSGTGLNQYVLVLARTGRGKEAVQSGISKLITVIKQQVPTISECIGPDEIASGPALYKQLSKVSSCFVSMLSEFGLRMQQLSDSYGNGSNVTLRRMILQLYGKSGFNDIANPSVYSDKDKDVAAISSPAFSILGETTPHTLYKNLNEEMITEGLLPRFLLIEYDGIRVPENPTHAEAKPSFELIDKLSTLAANAMTIQHAQPRRVINVEFSPDALQISQSYNRLCDKYINDPNSNETVVELWNRAHLKVIKLAATVAIGVNMFNPRIEPAHMNWAIDVVNSDTRTLSNKFAEGKIGANTQETKQIDDLIKILRTYNTDEWSEVSKYADKGDKGKKMHLEKVVSYSYISRRLIAMAAFRNDKIGATGAIKKCIQIMIDRDYIREMARNEMSMKFGTTQKAYIVTNTNILKENKED